MTRRALTLILCAALLLGCCTPARADVATLDRTLSRWMDNTAYVRFSAVGQVNVLLPFDEETLARLNGVLRHVTVDATLTPNGENSVTDAAIAVEGETVMDWTESLQDGAYTFTTSLLPNRVLTSDACSPMELLTGDAEETADTDETEDTADDGMNTSDVSEAFDFLSAIEAWQAYYQALTDGIQEFAEEKKANYKIKNIGTGKWSRIARLSTEQSDGLLNELRPLIACGMDETYRAEVEQMTFRKGFIVALYRNADGQDICVYLKGNVEYPDGTVRKFLWQWAFTTDGLERTDTFKYEVSKSSGTRDTRVIAASGTQVSKSDEYGVDYECETTLKRAKNTDACTETVNLSGKRDENGALPCVGEASREISQTVSGDTVKTAQTAEVNLLFTPEGDGKTLGGTLMVRSTQDKTVQNELIWTFGGTENASPAPVDAAEVDTEAETDVVVDLIPAQAETPAPETSEPPVSSLEQIAEGSGFEAASGLSGSTGTSDYLVGSAPVGLKEYAVPDTVTAVDMDGADAETLQNLLAEAAQNLAGKLIVAVAALPAEDASLLSDGMRDTDYAAFQAFLEALQTP